MIVARRLLGACLVCFGLFAAHPLSAAPSAAEMHARKAFAAGDYEKALGLFADLYAETLHPVYLRNIGRCHQKLRQPQKAIDAFQDYLAKGKNISAAERTEVEGYIHEMQGLLAAENKPEPAAAVVPTLPTPPPPVPSPSALAVGTSAQPVSPAPTASPEAAFYTRWWFWTGLGVVAVAAVSVILISSHNQSSSTVCPQGAICQ